MRTLATIMPRFSDGRGFNHAGEARCICGRRILFHINGAECAWCGAKYNDWGELIPPTPMDTAREYINRFCEFEYGEPADFSNPREVTIAYTDYEDLGISVQVYVDLVNFRIVYEYTSRYDFEQYDSIESMLPILEYMDFDALVCLPEDMLGGDEDA